MIKVFYFLLGFLLMVIGFFYTIVYINLISFGYNIKEYFLYLITRYECWFLVLGLLIILITLFRKEKKHDKRL